MPFEQGGQRETADRSFRSTWTWPGRPAGSRTWRNSWPLRRLSLPTACRSSGRHGPARQVLPERVTGASLVFSLSAAAAADGRSVYLLGGANGVPEKAAEALCLLSPGLRIAGTESPPFGFDRTEAGVQRSLAAVVAAAPDLVLAGLGFPRQEKLIEQLRLAWPAAWYLACGGGIPMAAGIARRASPLVQGLGLEWVHRLALEPRRLAGRYLRDDLPFAVQLLARAGMRPGQGAVS